MLGVLWMLWDDDNQGWHDKAVNSVVVDLGSRAGPHANPIAFFRDVLKTRAP